MKLVQAGLVEHVQVNVLKVLMLTLLLKIVVKDVFQMVVHIALAKDGIVNCSVVFSVTALFQALFLQNGIKHLLQKWFGAIIV